MTLFPVKAHQRRFVKPITTRNLQTIMPCTFQRAEQVFLSHIKNEESVEYQRLEARLWQIWNRVQRKPIVV